MAGSWLNSGILPPTNNTIGCTLKYISKSYIGHHQSSLHLMAASIVCCKYKTSNVGEDCDDHHHLDGMGVSITKIIIIIITITIIMFIVMAIVVALAIAAISLVIGAISGSLCKLNVKFKCVMLLLLFLLSKLCYVISSCNLH